ncbi:MAG: PDZ domain-containing protein [Deltaproteobacteria bacterium]|nr:PDZ domain-containing protein [Deltaproteobacteria bacterium]
MRLVVGLFAMFLTASVARADEAKAPDPKPEVARTKVPLRVVRVLPESHQALLFDKNKGTHVLADVGGVIDGYTVEEIGDDEVTLSSNGREIVLAAPAERQWRGNRNRQVAEAEPVRTAKKPTAVKADGPLDPYAEPAPAADAPQDPYADPSIAAGDGGVRVTSAAPPAFLPESTPPSVTALGMTQADPQNPYADPAIPADPYAATPAPASKKPAKPAKAAPSLDGFLPPGTSRTEATTFVVEPAPAPAPKKAAPAIVPAIEDAPPEAAPAPAPAPVPAGPVITPTVLSRSELNAQIADFSRLTGVLRGTFTPDGARLDLVAEGSVFSKAGLRRGDIITAVDNQPLRSIDDAAELYVRAPQTRAANIQLLRAGKPLTLRVLFQ